VTDSAELSCGPAALRAAGPVARFALNDGLLYPNDRRTSIRINATAVPDLQQEAIQAQSANVDIISGATLTSQAFVQSLQVALNSAKAGA
jgi:uncharacterized protein with FMN-binding domain